MSCREAQLLMSLHMRDDPGLTQARREAFEAHMLICSSCWQDYEQDKRIAALVRKYGPPISEGTRRLLGKGGYPVPECNRARRPRKPMTVEEGWADLKRRIPELAEVSDRLARQHRRRTRTICIFRRVGALAACLALVAVGGLWIHTQRTPGDPTTRKRIPSPWES